MDTNKILIIGGGVAGMEAAGQLLRLGYEPVIVERSDHLGGHVAGWHKLFPDMLSATELIEKLKSGIDGVTVYYKTRVANMNRLGNGYSVMLTNGVGLLCAAVLMASGFRGKEGQQVPPMTDEVVAGITDRYIELYEHITGTPFRRDETEDITGRIERNVNAFLAGAR